MNYYYINSVNYFLSFFLSVFFSLILYQFTVGLAPETLRRSNLGFLVPGSSVNLERALKADGRNSGGLMRFAPLLILRFNNLMFLSNIFNNNEFHQFHFSLKQLKTFHVLHIFYIFFFINSYLPLQAILSKVT